jgi:hypothetical protein
MADFNRRMEIRVHQIDDESGEAVPVRTYRLATWLERNLPRALDRIHERFAENGRHTHVEAVEVSEVGFGFVSGWHSTEPERRRRNQMRNRRRQILLQRKRIKARRRFQAEYLGEGKVRFVCLANARGERAKGCGRSHLKTYTNGGPSGISWAYLANQVTRWNDGGAHGTCPHCTRKLRDRLHPLDEEKKTR